MKCPHCGQEHPDSFQFCPVTGSKIVIKEDLIACENPKCPDFGEKVLPIDSKFCPTCGLPLSMNENTFTNFLSNLKRGEVSFGGIVLGKTKIGDLRRMGFHKDDYCDKQLYVFNNEDETIECSAFNFSMKELSDYEVLEDVRDAFPGEKFNQSVLLNKEKFITSIKIDLESIAEGEYEDWEILDMLEDCGYSEVELEDYGEYSEDTIFLVSDKKVCGEYCALIILDSDDSECLVSICPWSEWTLRKSGGMVQA